MKKLGKFRLAVLMLCLLGLYGCTQAEEHQENLSVPEIKIGITVYRKEDTFISSIVTAFEEAAKEAEQTKNIRITANITDGKGNQMVQNEQIDKFIEQKYDVICVNLVDRTVAASIIDKAKAANIPLVFFNREPVREDLKRWDKVYYVGAVAQQSGALQGKIVAQLYEQEPARVDKNGDGKLQYVMLEGEQGHQDALLRTETSVKAITSAGIEMDKLANDTANWHRSQATTKMSQWIDKYGGEIEVVLCNNDDMALGAIDAYEAAKKMHMLPVIVGIDGIPQAKEALAAGTLAGTVKNDGGKQAQAMLQLCYALAFNKDVGQDVKIVKGKYVFIEYSPMEMTE